MAMISLMSSTGRPTAVNTIAMVTSPADGIPAAPIAAAVAVRLKKNKPDISNFDIFSFFYQISSGDNLQ